MTRIVIIGSPRAGKTTYALALAARERVRVRHTDDLITMVSWSKVSEIVAFQWFADPGPWIIEGVAAVRALRKWLAANSEGVPCDEVIVLEQPHVELTPGQASMAKACATIWAQVEGEIRARGVIVEVDPPWDEDLRPW